MNRSAIVNAKLLTPDSVEKNCCIKVTGSRIESIGTYPFALDGYEIIDAKGCYVSPGFIDIHTHGGGGHDFMDGTAEAYLEAARIHAKHGATTIYPTTVACSNETLEASLDAYEKALSMNTSGAQMPGIHLEGPYISKSQAGAIDPQYIKDPVPEEYQALIQKYPFIKRWTAAPELPGIKEFARYLKDNGVLFSIGHSDAFTSQAEAAFQNGAAHVTHLYSATSMVRRINAKRYSGVLEAAYLNDHMTVEIIADGMHLPKELIQLVYKIKGSGHTALITDSMRAAGCDPGPSILGSKKDGIPVIADENVAWLPDRSAFAGSIATCDTLIRTMLDSAGIPLHEAVKMLTETPARVMGINNNKGSLKKGFDADIIIFDKNINIISSFIMGVQIF